MLSKIFFIVVCTFAVSFANAAEKTKYSVGDNAISIELAGRAGLYSLNYDTMVTDRVAIGIGGSFFSVSSSDALTGTSTSATLMVFPIYANYYFSEGNHRLFATAGLDIIAASGSINSYAFRGSGVLFVGGGGYEYRADGGFLFRAAPYIMVGSGATAVTLGIGLGYAF